MTTNTEWYYKAVLWACEKGITTGVTETTFEPNTICSRAMIVTFLYRYEAALNGIPTFTPTENVFSDVVSDEYYYNAVTWATQNSIVKGYGNGMFGTNDPCTRAQIVTFLYRYYN